LAEALPPEDLSRLVYELSKFLQHRYGKWTELQGVEEVREYLEWLRFRDSRHPDGRRFSLLLERYVYLRDHLADAFIAATAWEKNLEVVTTNARHVEPIAELRVRRFPDDCKSDE
jgi:predicted nucleic acid-binding protein